MSTAEPLHVVDLSAGYGRRPVISGLALPPLPTGQVHAVIGPNAAGKSTLLRALAGLLSASGKVYWQRQELLAMPLEERARHVTYMPQSLPQGVALSVLETVLGALYASGAPAMQAGRDAVGLAAATLADVGISHLALERLDRLSGGQRQLVSLAQSMVRNTPLLLLDEPLSALDLNFQLRVMQMLRRRAQSHGTTSLVVLHDLQVAAQWADRIVVIHQGKLAACGSPAEALTPALLAEVYQVAARVEACSNGRLQVLVDDLLGNPVRA